MEGGKRLSDWDAAAYSRVGDPQLNWGRTVLDRVTLRGDETVLDAGCGDGRLTLELVERLPRGRVVAVDRSERMSRAAAGRLAPTGRASTVRADLLGLPFNEVVDGIFSAAVFHWVLDHPRLFANLFKALRPGGWVNAQCGGAGNLDHTHGQVIQLMFRPDFAAWFQNWDEPWEFADPETAEARLLQAGFVDVEAWLTPAPTTFANGEAYRDFMQTVVLRPFLDRLPEQTLKTAFLDAMTERAGEDRPPFMLDYWRLNLRARKPELE